MNRPQPLSPSRFTRREWLALSSMAGAWGVVRFLTACGGDNGGGNSYPPLKPVAMPPAPEGICAVPEGDIQLTLWALAETIVPGPGIDPTGAPGANETCALTIALDPTFPLAEVAAIVSQSLDVSAQQQFSRNFRDLAYAERILVAEAVEAQIPLFTLLYRLIRAAFYGASYNEIGERWMEFPGENLGYINHPDFSIRRPIGRELTSKGNLP